MLNVGCGASAGGDGGTVAGAVGVRVGSGAVVNVGSGMVVRVGSGVVVKVGSGVVVNVGSGMVVRVGSGVVVKVGSGVVVVKPRAPTASVGIRVVVGIISNGLPAGSPIKKRATTIISSAGRLIRAKPVRTCRCQAGPSVDSGGVRGELAIMDGGLSIGGGLYTGCGTTAPATAEGLAAIGGVEFTTVGWL